MQRRDKRQLGRIILSAFLLAIVITLDKLGLFPSMHVGNFNVLPLLIYLLPYTPVAYTVLSKAARNISHGQVFDENFLMSIATAGAFVTGEYAEAIFVMLFYQVGELFEHIAVGKSRNSIKSLLSIRTDTAFIEDENGNLCSVACEDVSVGEIVTVKSGGKIPFDGIIVEGKSSLNTVALTGESLPRNVEVGDEVLSGCVNEGGVIKVKVSKPFEESTASKILALVESSVENKSRSEDFITSFARIYTPAVVIGALLLAILPPIFINVSSHALWQEWIMRAMTFLVISCPCALVISVPLSYFGGIGSASLKGILIKGSCYLDALSRCDSIVFDKTGTLTEGALKVTDAYFVPEFDQKTALSLVLSAEKYSTHPISIALTKYCEENKISPSENLQEVEEISGRGIKARIWDKELIVGNENMMCEEQIPTPNVNGGIAVFIALDGKYIGHVILSDTPKENSRQVIESLRLVGIKKMIMLSGDRSSEASRVANLLSLDGYFSELLPRDKVNSLESIMSSSKGLVAYVGDGINDAPVIARADVGIAMGALGSDAAIEAADIVLMNDNLETIKDAIILSKRTRRIVIQNIVIALGIKAAALVLGALGVVGLSVAIFADVGVAVIAILNSMRNLKQ